MPSEVDNETKKWMLRHKDRVHELCNYSQDGVTTDFHKYLKALSEIP